jgi:hypothetical protein
VGTFTHTFLWNFTYHVAQYIHSLLTLILWKDADKLKFIIPSWNIGRILVLTYSWSCALLEEPPILQLLKNFPAFYGTRRFITVFTRALYWYLT